MTPKSVRGPTDLLRDARRMEPAEQKCTLNEIDTSKDGCMNDRDSTTQQPFEDGKTIRFDCEVTDSNGRQMTQTRCYDPRSLTRIRDMNPMAEWYKQQIIPPLLHRPTAEEMAYIEEMANRLTMMEGQGGDDAADMQVEEVRPPEVLSYIAYTEGGLQLLYARVPYHGPEQGIATQADLIDRLFAEYHNQNLDAEILEQYGVERPSAVRSSMMYNFEKNELLYLGIRVGNLEYVKVALLRGADIYNTSKLSAFVDSKLDFQRSLVNLRLQTGALLVDIERLKRSLKENVVDFGLRRVCETVLNLDPSEPLDPFIDTFINYVWSVDNSDWYVSDNMEFLLNNRLEDERLRLPVNYTIHIIQNVKSHMTSDWKKFISESRQQSYASPEDVERTNAPLKTKIKQVSDVPVFALHAIATLLNTNDDSLIESLTGLCVDMVDQLINIANFGPHFVETLTRAITSLVQGKNLKVNDALLRAAPGLLLNRQSWRLFDTDHVVDLFVLMVQNLEVCTSRDLIDSILAFVSEYREKKLIDGTCISRSIYGFSSSVEFRRELEREFLDLVSKTATGTVGDADLQCRELCTLAAEIVVHGSSSRLDVHVAQFVCIGKFPGAGTMKRFFSERNYDTLISSAEPTAKQEWHDIMMKVLMKTGEIHTIVWCIDIESSLFGALFTNDDIRRIIKRPLLKTHTHLQILLETAVKGRHGLVDDDLERRVCSHFSNVKVGTYGSFLKLVLSNIQTPSQTSIQAVLEMNHFYFKDSGMDGGLPISQIPKWKPGVQENVRSIQPPTKTMPWRIEYEAVDGDALLLQQAFRDMTTRVPYDVWRNDGSKLMSIAVTRGHYFAFSTMLRLDMAATQGDLASLFDLILQSGDSRYAMRIMQNPFTMDRIIAHYIAKKKSRTYAVGTISPEVQWYMDNDTAVRAAQFSDDTFHREFLNAMKSAHDASTLTLNTALQANDTGLIKTLIRDSHDPVQVRVDYLSRDPNLYVSPAVQKYMDDELERLMFGDDSVMAEEEEFLRYQEAIDNAPRAVDPTTGDSYSSSDTSSITDVINLVDEESSTTELIDLVGYQSDDSIAEWYNNRDFMIPVPHLDDVDMHVIGTRVPITPPLLDSIETLH